MARKVFVSSDMSIDERLIEVAEANPTAALLWPWLLTTFDDWGRAEANARRLKAQVFPAISSLTSETIEDALAMFQAVGLIRLYEMDRKRYMAIPQDKWYKYQTHMNRKDRRQGKDKMKSDFPAPPDDTPTDPHGDARGLMGTQRGPIPSPSPSPSPLRDKDPSSHPDGATKESKPKPGATRADFAEDSVEMHLAKHLRQRILENLPTAKVPVDNQIQSWCRQFDLMLRVDNRDPPEVEAVIDWCQGDPFWRSNILSPKKLREKYDQLALKRKKPPEMVPRNGPMTNTERALEAAKRFLEKEAQHDDG